MIEAAIFTGGFVGGFVFAIVYAMWLMELDPKYCDVIVKRWCEFTGEDAILERTGETFSVLKNGSDKNAA